MREEMKIRIEKKDDIHRIFDENGKELEFSMKLKNDYCSEIWDVFVPDSWEHGAGFYIGEWYRDTNTLNVTNLQLEILQ
jgi:hypothetical protein